MKSINFLLKIFFVANFVLLCSFCFAQGSYSLSDAISRMPTVSAPLDARKFMQYPRGAWIVNPNNIIPDKLYDNAQLTQYVNATISPELGAQTRAKFAIPNSSDKVLVLVRFGHGSGEQKTEVLCVVQLDGTVLSTLEVVVMGGMAFVKQFRITAQTKIIVTTIIPTSSTSIPLDTFTSFSGYRQDITYSVNVQGQFVQESVQNYQTKTYTRSALEDKNVNLWEGGETPI